MADEIAPSNAPAPSPAPAAPSAAEASPEAVPTPSHGLHPDVARHLAEMDDRLSAGQTDGDSPVPADAAPQPDASDQEPPAVATENAATSEDDEDDEDEAPVAAEQPATTDNKPLSKAEKRRLREQRAREEREREWQSREESLRATILQEQTERQRLAKDAETRRQAEMRAANEVRKYIGDDQVFADLQWKVSQYQATEEERTRFTGMLNARQMYQPMRAAAEQYASQERQGIQQQNQRFIAGLTQSFNERATKLPRVNPEVVMHNPDPGALFEHAWYAGQAHGTDSKQAELDTYKTEVDARITRLEAENKDLRTRVAGGHAQPQAPGRSAPTSNGRYSAERVRNMSDQEFTENLDTILSRIPDPFARRR